MKEDLLKDYLGRSLYIYIILYTLSKIRGDPKKNF